MWVKVYQAFVKDGLGGNAAGIVLENKYYSDIDKQRIAKKVALSETVFIENSACADYKMTYFTPEAQVDLCGHATIAAFGYLFDKEKIGQGEYSLETQAGILKVCVSEGGLVVMTQKPPEFYETVPYDVVGKALNLPLEAFDFDYPSQIVSTGLKDILVAVRSKDILNGLKPDFSKMAEISDRYQVVGFHVFALNENPQDGLASCRNFAPLYGIDEEAATGTSSGALGAYLYTHSQGHFKKTLEKGTVFLQGEAMNQPSKIWVKCQMDRAISVYVGGYALEKSSLSVD